MKHIYNLGCSFAYGNCAESKNVLGKHLSPGMLLAEHLNLKEINYAVPGCSLDGVLRKLYTYDIKKDGYILIGVPPVFRFNYVAKLKSIDPTKKPREKKVSLYKRILNKIVRDEKDTRLFEPSDTRKFAFTRGPSLPEDYFKTDKFTHIRSKEIPERVDLDHTLAYFNYFYITLIQLRLREMNMPYFIYNSVDPIYDIDKVTNTELKKLYESIDFTFYYKPDKCINTVVNSNFDKYIISDDDIHPNHLAYREWFIDFKNWVDERIKNEK